ncbi:hypothetical protein TESG_07422 [Trichophyton tonsurans CBS 112818]|uniref:Uncharacterized protein n=1 Tax=Trichophyton tonsurans (strain CBS 112818) TaxID=647933 RepID=F2S950_TRIT1|nr:hypothetical protein TESG_07422 [Trichophyton tonsurans CBS 112818]
MELLDLPPELCDEIFNQIILTSGCDASSVRLVSKLFNCGIIRAYTNVRVMKEFFDNLGCWPPRNTVFYTYAKLSILREESNSTYAIRTIRETVKALLQAEKTTSHELKAEKTLLLVKIACSVITPVTISKAFSGYCPWSKGYHRTTQTPKSLIHVLSAAVHDDNIRLVAELLKWGVSCNQSSQVFGTPLCIAASRGNMEMVNLLLKFRADPSYFFRLHDRSNPRTPLQAAAFAGHEEIVDLLLQPNLGVQRSGDRFYRALVFAARGGHFNTFKQLVDAAAPQADPLFRWADCLMAACESGSIYLVRFILYKGGDIECMRRFETPLIRVARKGYHDIARVLLEAGADPDYDSQNHSAITMACRCGRLEVVRVLLQFGAYVDARFGSIRNAAAGGHKDIIQLLLDHGAQVSGREPDRWRDTGQKVGQLAYEIAIKNGHHSLASWLLTLGVDMDNHVDTVYEWSSCDETPIITSDDEESLGGRDREGEGGE